MMVTIRPTRMCTHCGLARLRRVGRLGIAAQEASERHHSRADGGERAPGTSQQRAGRSAAGHHANDPNAQPAKPMHCHDGAVRHEVPRPLRDAAEQRLHQPQAGPDRGHQHGPRAGQLQRAHQQWCERGENSGEQDRRNGQPPAGGPRRQAHIRQPLQRKEPRAAARDDGLDDQGGRPPAPKAPRARQTSRRRPFFRGCVTGKPGSRRPPAHPR